MNKAKEQFELFCYDETHNINEWDNGNMWICDCPKVQTELFHCEDCNADPPGGCECVYCIDLTTFREVGNERAKKAKGKFALAWFYRKNMQLSVRL
jgi:hypothetical protein